MLPRETHRFQSRASRLPCPWRSAVHQVAWGESGARQMNIMWHNDDTLTFSSLFGSAFMYRVIS